VSGIAGHVGEDTQQMPASISDLETGRSKIPGLLQSVIDLDRLTPTRCLSNQPAACLDLPGFSWRTARQQQEVAGILHSPSRLRLSHPSSRTLKAAQSGDRLFEELPGESFLLFPFVLSIPNDVFRRQNRAGPDLRVPVAARCGRR